MVTETSVRHRVAHAAFFILFPGFFFYHTAVGTGLIPPILGGFFSPLTLLLLPVLTVFYGRAYFQRRLGSTAVDKWFWGFLIYFCMVIAVNFVLRPGNQNVAYNHLLSVSHLSVVFLIFRLCNFSSSGLHRMTTVSLVLMSVLTIYLSAGGMFYLDAQSDAEVASYQGFGRSYLVCFLVVLPFLRARAWSWAICALALACLYVNGARSEFLAAIIAVVVIEVFRSSHRIATFLALVAGGLALLYSQELLITLLPNNRMLQLLDLSTSTSWDSRSVLLDNAINSILAHPFLGDYGAYARNNGGAGNYAHNILSAWVDLGIIGFLYLLLLLVVPTLKAALSALAAKNFRVDQISILVLIVLVNRPGFRGGWLV